MRLHTTHALLGGLAAVAAMVALNASAQPSNGEVPRGQSSAAPSSSAQSADDSKFLQEAIRGNTAEVKMGELAKQHAQSKDVRDYGQMLIDDHSKANDKAIAAAKSMNVTAPTEPSAQQKQEHDMIAKLSGSQFDSMFMDHMVRDHQEDIAKVHRASADWRFLEGHGLCEELAADAEGAPLEGAVDRLETLRSVVVERQREPATSASVI